MIDRYLERGDMFVLNDNGVKAICVVADETNGICELKNIAVTSESQRQGYDKRLINYLVKHYAGKYTQMIVGTGDVPSSVSFYKSCEAFPCAKFKSFAKRWLKYGQDFVANQKLLKQAGEMEFLKQYNQRTV